MAALAGALGGDDGGEEPPMEGGEMTPADAALGATMDAGTNQGGAPAEIASDSGSAPPAPMVTESDPDDEAEHEHGPDDVDIA